MGQVHLGVSEVGIYSKEEQHPDQKDQQEKLSRPLHDTKKREAWTIITRFTTLTLEGNRKGWCLICV